MTYIVKERLPRQEIIIGGYGAGKERRRTPNYSGPMSNVDWEHNKTGYFQRLPNPNLVNIEYTATDGTKVQIYQIRELDVKLMDKTLNLVPPSHLKWFNSKKPEGIILNNVAGRNSYAKYTGGLNPHYDDKSTDFFDERKGILITYGAVWKFKHLGIIPTVLHELGHVMTHQGRIHYGKFGTTRKQKLKALSVSRNEGKQEALCNTYMYFICYGSSEPIIRKFGTGNDIQRDHITRAALRKCWAFSKMLTGTWKSRFAERGK